MNETEIGSLAINLQIKLDALEKDINTAKKKLQEIEESNKKVEESNKGLEGSYLAMSAVAIASLVKIAGVIKDCVNEYNTYTQAMSSLQDVANHTGQSMSDFSDIMSEFSTYMTQDDLAATIKNFTLMGYSADETRKMIEALTNSAIKNRNANYTVSQAVKVASDGYKQGLSTLSDSAGVTENLSVMLDTYAKSIGKTASQLTETEKNQAYLNRTMIAAEPFAGAMAGYMDTLAGKQGAYAQAMRETQVAYAEALEPILSEGIVKMTNLLNVLTGFIDSNPALVSGITAGALTLGVATVAIIALKKGVEAFSKSVTIATIKQKGFNAALEANPVIAAVSLLTTLIGVTVGITSAVGSYREAQERLNEVNKIAEEIENGKYKYTSENAQKVQENVENIKKQIELQEQIIEKEREMQKISAEQKQYGGFGKNADYDKWKELDNQWQQLYKTQKELKDKLKEAQKETSNYGNTVGELNQKLQTQQKYLDDYNAIQDANIMLDTEVIRKKKQEASQVILTAKEHRKYIDVIKNGNKDTEDYITAVENLAKVYPEAVSASGPLISELEMLIQTEEETANETYNASQSIIQDYKNILNSILQDESKSKIKQVAENLAIPVDDLIPKLKNAISLYEVLYGKTAEEMGGTYTSKKTTGGTSAYQNKALDDYKKQIEYKKNLNKISAEEEIKMYEYALKNLAKINDEKMDLEVEIYQLRKQLIEDYIDAEKDALDKRTEDSERWIEEQKLSAKEQEEAYNRIITYHKEYLDKMVADERLSLEQKNTIWREEINLIKDYQAQIRDLRIETVDNTYEALKNALTEQANQLQEVEENAINKSLESLENSKNKKIDMINVEYNARIKAIDDELKALEESEKEKNRLEEQEDYKKKKKRLEGLIAYEHDAVTKATYEKELAKLNEDYQKTLDEQTLEDKKQALSIEKDNLKEEQQNKIDSINTKYEKEKEYLNNRLVVIQENYDKEREMADKNAQMMLLNTEAHQDEIINLLKTYGDEYELLGTTWGERVVEAFEDKVKGIVSTVENLNTQLNKAIEVKMSNIANSSANGVTSAEIAAKKAYSEVNKEEIAAIAKANGVDLSVAESMYKSGTTVIQNNNFNVPVEKPSTLLEKTKNTLQSLGELLRRAQ